MREAIVYKVEKDIMTNENNTSYVTYGICVYLVGDREHKKIDEIKDISIRKQFVQDMAQKFNVLKLAKEHFRECVLDSINEF